MLYPSKWTPVVLEHFNKFVSPSIQYHSGKRVIEEYLGMFDPYSGITNNLLESMNVVLKREHDWKELPVDLLALGFITFKTLRTMKFYVAGQVWVIII